ncbi:MAG: IPT/TIG domain-containing protein [Planctomycetes bacterium]|nr:IPT/TIG domain-containing protein [Planctomycetota bacterium]
MKTNAPFVFIVVFFLTLIGAFARTAVAQGITDVSPPSGSIGIPITITGTGFGATKGKVSFESATKKIAMTVKSWSDTEVDGILPSGKSDSYAVKLTTKTKTVFTAPSNYVINAPVITAIMTFTPGVAFTGEIATLVGADFGGKKGTVKFGTVAAKIIAWADEAVVITVPKVKDGTYNVLLTNTIGSWFVTQLVGTPNTGTISGTAAKGSAIANATISVVDKKGGSKTGAQTDANGAFTINVQGLVLPFLIKLDVPGGGALFSVAGQAGVVNIDGLTDHIIKIWYDSQGSTAAAAFSDILNNPLPSASQLETIKRFVEDNIQIWLTGAGLDPAVFDLITTPFAADGNGFDGVLNKLTVQDNGTSLTLQLQDTPQNPTLTESVNITFDVPNSTATSAATTTGPSGTSQSTSTINLSNGSGTISAIAGINASLAQFQSIINTKGLLLKNTDLTPLAAPGLMNEGMNASDTFAGFVTDIRGLTLQSVQVTKLISIDANGVADVEFQVVMSNGTQSELENVRFFFKKIGSAWKWLGDQKIAEVSATFEFNTDLPGFNPHFSTPYNRVNIDVRAPKGTISSVTVSGGNGLFNNTNAIKDPQTVILDFEPVPGTFTQFQQDAFFASGDPGQALPAGTPITVTITPVSGPQVSYTYYAKASTSEVTSLTAPTGHTMTDAKLGQTLHMTWTLPVTFPIYRIKASAHVLSQNFECEVDPINPIFTTSTTFADFNMPALCNGEAIISANLNLSFDGVNGERIQFLYNFQ